MAMDIMLEGIDVNSKEAEIYSDGFFVGQGHIFGPNSGTRKSIVNIAEKHKIDAKEFKVLFRDYKKEVLTRYKNYSVKEIENLPPVDRSKIKLGIECEFVLDTEDVIWLKDFSDKLIKSVETKDKYQQIVEKARKIKPFGNLHDALNDYEYDCYDALPSLRVLSAICEKALELGVNLKVTR
jgi:hypothetical protein